LLALPVKTCRRRKYERLFFASGINNAANINLKLQIVISKSL
jgi:hypothetical protein